MRMLARTAAIVAALVVSIPAIACNMQNIGPEDFCGKYRAGPKTSFFKTDGQVAPFEHYGDLKALLDTLPGDDEMFANGNWSPQRAPKSRLDVEKHNVEVVAYIVAVKPGEDDRDFHVIVSEDPSGRGQIFMNVEVSGLPRNHVDLADFQRARTEIRSIVPQVAGGAPRYVRVSNPPKVVIQGSLYFDGDHRAGCAHCPGPSYAKPSTVWEIHPVYNITEQ